jgi:CBS domain-containing membrane protein
MEAVMEDTLAEPLAPSERGRRGPAPPIVVDGDGDGDLVGLLSHRDLLRSSLIERAGLPLSFQNDVMRRIRVEEVMTSEVETAEAGQPLQEAALLMFENKYGCLPVVEGARVVGTVEMAKRWFYRRMMGERVPSESLAAV